MGMFVNVFITSIVSISPLFFDNLVLCMKYLRAKTPASYVLKRKSEYMDVYA